MEVPGTWASTSMSFSELGITTSTQRSGFSGKSSGRSFGSFAFSGQAASWKTGFDGPVK